MFFLDEKMSPVSQTFNFLGVNFTRVLKIDFLLAKTSKERRPKLMSFPQYGYEKHVLS